MPIRDQFTPCFFKIHFNSILMNPEISQDVFILRMFRLKLYMDFEKNGHKCIFFNLVFYRDTLH
jgi:hypothetical protein